MSGKSENERIHIIGYFKDRAIPLSGADPAQDLTRFGTRSVNQEIVPFADFRDQAQLLQGQATESGTPNNSTPECKMPATSPLSLILDRLRSLEAAIDGALGAEAQQVRDRMRIDFTALREFLAKGYEPK